jgi:hypothetical protein
MAPGLPIPQLLAPAGLNQWLQLDGMQAGLCAPQAAGCSLVQQQPGATDPMQQLLNQQAMQQLLGLLDAQAAH